MNKVWKWIIGILLGLLAMAVAVPLVFGLWRAFMFGSTRWTSRGLLPERFHDFEMMRPTFYHMSPFGMWGGILMWLVPVALILLLAVGVAAIVNAFRRPAAQPAVLASAVSTDTAAAAPATPAPSAPAEPGRVCAHCGRAAETDWKVCPYCTEALD